MMIRTFLVMALFSMLACTNSSVTGGNGKMPFDDGTSDSGGGNGVENKAYEAYIVKTEQLPAFKKLIAPKIEQLTRLAPDSARSMSIVRRWLLYKTWYIAPVALNTISKDVIGVSFSSDQTEQLALQTKKSVWINLARFNQMSQQDQATLIIHEMVMSLYYLKFKSWEQVCTEKIYPDITCSGQETDLLNEMFPGSTPKPFDADDYENIRAVTGAFLGDFPFRTYQDLDQFLIQNNFDRRFTFGLGMTGDSHQERVIFNNDVKISPQELEDVLNLAPALNQQPDQCRSLRFNQTFDCRFSFAKVPVKNSQGYEFPFLVLQTDSQDGTLPISFGGGTTAFGEATGSSVEFVSLNRKLYYFLFSPFPGPTSPTVGTFFRSTVLVLMQDTSIPGSPKTLLGLISIPGIVTGANASYPGECTFAKPAAQSPMNDVVTVYSRHLDDFQKNLLRVRATSMPPFTSCKQW